MGVGGLGAFFITVIIIALLGLIAYVFITQLRVRRLGLPQPALSSYNPFQRSQNYANAGSGAASGGVSGWFSSKFRSFKNRGNRTAGGAYEEPLSSNVRGRASNRGFGPLDPDDAWDARVGGEADAYGPYEEQELGLHGEQTGYTGSGYIAPGESRGRSRSREPEPYVGGSKAGLDRRYDEEMGRQPTRSNPFGDEAEPSSLRGVSPRPMDAHRARVDDESPTERTERRSIFLESVN